MRSPDRCGTVSTIPGGTISRRNTSRDDLTGLAAGLVTTGRIPLIVSRQRREQIGDGPTEVGRQTPMLGQLPLQEDQLLPALCGLLGRLASPTLLGGEGQVRGLPPGKVGLRHDALGGLARPLRSLLGIGVTHNERVTLYRMGES